MPRPTPYTEAQIRAMIKHVELNGVYHGLLSSEHERAIWLACEQVDEPEPTDGGTLFIREGKPVALMMFDVGWRILMD